MANILPRNLREGLVLWLDEKGKDLSGLGNNGTLVNSPTVVRRLQQRGLNYTTSQYCNLGNVLNFEYNQPFTKSFWNKTTDGSSAKHLMSKQSSTTTFGPWIEITGGKYACWLYSTSGYITGSTPLTYNDGVWRMVTFTYNGNQANSGVKCYINGVEIALTYTGTGAVSGTLVNTTGFQINGRWNSTDSTHTGTLINPIIYNRVLTPTEIQQLYIAQYIK